MKECYAKFSQDFVIMADGARPAENGSGGAELRVKAQIGHNEERNSL